MESLGISQNSGGIIIIIPYCAMYMRQQKNKKYKRQVHNKNMCSATCRPVWCFCSYWWWWWC